MAAYQESDVVGFISFIIFEEDCAEIDCLGVKKSPPRSRNWKGINYDYRKRSSQTSDYLQVKTVAIRTTIELMSFIAVLDLVCQRFSIFMGYAESMSDSDKKDQTKSA